MDRLPTRIDRGSDEFGTRRERNLELAEDLRQRLDTARRGGEERHVERHRERGKRLPRERITEVCDPGSPFLEMSSLAADGLYDGKAHSAGIVTGIG
ncbi:MAG: methylcrotonoyl-CoA carboxylase, partial [Candidatus Thermoplasmatota archaeon]|nr:methylcrotonoyl-CoA carboxylase [Candidatus Thermoplasmatota archaeon]